MRSNPTPEFKVGDRIRFTVNGVTGRVVQVHDTVNHPHPFAFSWIEDCEGTLCTHGPDQLAPAEPA